MGMAAGCDGWPTLLQPRPCAWDANRDTTLRYTEKNTCHTYYLQLEQIKLDLRGQDRDSPTMHILSKANGKWSCGKQVFLHGYAILNSRSVRDSVQETTDSDLTGQSVEWSGLSNSELLHRVTAYFVTIQYHTFIQAHIFKQLCSLYTFSLYTFTLLSWIY